MRRCSTLSASSMDDSDFESGSTRASLDSLLGSTASQLAELQQRSVAVSDVPRRRSTLTTNSRLSPNSQKNELPPKAPGTKHDPSAPSLGALLLHRSSGSGRRGSTDSAASYDTFDNCSSDDAVEAPRGGKHRESLDTLLLNTKEQIADLKQRGVAAVDHPRRHSTLAGGRASPENQVRHLPPKPPPTAKRAAAAAAARCEQLRRSSFDSTTSNEMFGDASSDDCDKVERRGGRHRESLDSLISSTAEQLAELRQRTVAVSDAPRRRSALVGGSRLSQSEPPARLTNRRREQPDRAAVDALQQQQQQLQYITAQAVSLRCEQLRSSSSMRRASTDSSASHEVHSIDSDFDDTASARGRESLDSLLVNTAAQIADLKRAAVAASELPRRRATLSSSEHSLEAVTEPLSSEHSDAASLVHTEQPAVSSNAARSSDSRSSSSSSSEQPDEGAAQQPVRSECDVSSVAQCTELQVADVTADVTALSESADDSKADAVNQLPQPELQQPAAAAADPSRLRSSPSSSDTSSAESNAQSSASSDAAPGVQVQQADSTSQVSAKLEQPQHDDSSSSASSSSSSSSISSSSAVSAQAVHIDRSCTAQPDTAAQHDSVPSVQHDQHCEADAVAAAVISCDAASEHSMQLLSSSTDSDNAVQTQLVVDMPQAALISPGQSSSCDDRQYKGSSISEKVSSASSADAVTAPAVCRDSCSTEQLTAAQRDSATSVQRDQHCEAGAIEAALISSAIAPVHSTQLLRSSIENGNAVQTQFAAESPQAALFPAVQASSSDDTQYDKSNRASVASQSVDSTDNLDSAVANAGAVQQQHTSLDDSHSTAKQQHNSEEKAAATVTQSNYSVQLKQAAAEPAVEPAVCKTAAAAVNKRLQLLWQHPSDIGLGVSMYPGLDRAALKQLQREWAAEVYKAAN
jgi:trimeric autotransporter adhesin